MSIRLMAMPNQSLWRLFAEIILRLPVNHPSGHDSEGNGRGRLWVHIEPDKNDSEARYVMYMPFKECVLRSGN